MKNLLDLIMNMGNEKGRIGGSNIILTLVLGLMRSQQRRKLGKLVGNRETSLGQKNELGLRGRESETQAAISEIVRAMAPWTW